MPRWIVNPVKGLWQLAKESFKQYGVSRTKVIIEVEFSYSKAQDANSEMAAQVRSRRKPKLAHSVKRQRLVANKQQPGVEHWYE